MVPPKGIAHRVLSPDIKCPMCGRTLRLDEAGNESTVSCDSCGQIATRLSPNTVSYSKAMCEFAKAQGVSLIDIREKFLKGVLEPLMNATCSGSPDAYVRMLRIYGHSLAHYAFTAGRSFPEFGRRVHAMYRVDCGMADNLKQFYGLTHVVLPESHQQEGSLYWGRNKQLLRGEPDMGKILLFERFTDSIVVHCDAGIAMQAIKTGDTAEFNSSARLPQVGNGQGKRRG